MNLYLRLIWTVLRSWWLPAFKPGAVLERKLDVLPNDLDINGHINNGRYLTIVDLLLVEYFVRTGFLQVMISSGWRPVSGGAIITYRKAIKPWRSYRVRFSLAAVDTTWNYMRFDFLADNGMLYASGYMKGAAVGRDGLVNNSASYAKLHIDPPTSPLPDAVQHWLAAENTLMNEHASSG